MNQEAIQLDLKAASFGVGVISNPNLKLDWVENIQGKSALKVSPVKQEHCHEDKWLLIFEDIQFDDAVIEFDALGQSEPPQSNFLGIAFYARDDAEHDAIYYRPFNFMAKDPIRRIHAVQYVSHPQHTWFSLREQFPEQYEKPVTPASSGDEWFHAKIEISPSQIKAYINHADKPSLAVKPLVKRQAKKFGLWVGPGVGGYFANLVVQSIK